MIIIFSFKIILIKKLCTLELVKVMHLITLLNLLYGGPVGGKTDFIRLITSREFVN